MIIIKNFDKFEIYKKLAIKIIKFILDILKLHEKLAFFLDRKSVV